MTKRDRDRYHKFWGKLADRFGFSVLPDMSNHRSRQIQHMESRMYIHPEGTRGYRVCIYLCTAVVKFGACYTTVDLACSQHGVDKCIDWLSAIKLGIQIFRRLGNGNIYIGLVLHTMTLKRGRKVFALPWSKCKWTFAEAFVCIWDRIIAINVIYTVAYLIFLMKKVRINLDKWVTVARYTLELGSLASHEDFVRSCIKLSLIAHGVGILNSD